MIVGFLGKVQGKPVLQGLFPSTCFPRGVSPVLAMMLTPHCFHSNTQSTVSGFLVYHHLVLYLQSLLQQKMILK